MQYNPYLANPYMQQAIMPQVPQVPQYQQPVNGIVKVNGQQSAMQVQLPPNSTSQPMIDASFDGKHGMFYVVSTDGTGMKTVECFDFQPHVDQQPAHMAEPDYVSRAEFQGLVEKVNQMIGGAHGTDGPVQAAAGQ